MDVAAAKRKSRLQRFAAHVGSADVRICWWPLLPLLVLTTAVPLAIHARMIAMGIPLPKQPSPTSFTAWTNDLLTAIGTLILLTCLSPRHQRLSAIRRVVALLVLIAGMSGHLFRDTFMDVINTEAPVVSVSTGGYMFQEALRNLPLGLIVSLSVVASSIANASRPGVVDLLVKGSTIACIVWLAEGFFIHPLAAPAVAWFDARARNGIEQPPYDARILIPAYATFAENALSTTIVVALVWKRLPGRAVQRISTATGLVLLLIGPVAQPFIDGLSEPGRWMAVLAPGQFTLETLALGIGAGLTCAIALRPRLGRQ